MASAELTARIKELFRRVWNENQSQMSRDLGIDQGAISRVLTKKQNPSSKFLEQLATWPRINSNWLFRGEGAPLADMPTQSGGHYLPIADKLLPGAPYEYPHLLSGESFPVAEAYYTSSRYWYRVPPRSPLFQTNGLRSYNILKKIQVNDLLLLDTDSWWTKQNYDLLGRLCCVSLKIRRRKQVVFGMVDNGAEDYAKPYEPFRVDIYGDHEHVMLIISQTDEGVSEGRRETNETCIGVDDVVAVCLQMVRSFYCGKEWSN